MKIVYLDCFSGISGDMFIAAFLDSGLIEARYLKEKLSALGLGKVKVIEEEVQRGPIAATHVSFECNSQTRTQRGFAEIKELIQASELTSAEKKRTLQIFQSLAEAEARIHNSSIERAHFHELGALDSILDIVGAAVIVEKLKIERYYASRVNVGGGFVDTKHGRLPVPAPATLELLKGMPMYSSGIEAELVTPTGAAILKNLVTGYEMPQARWQHIGYGAGSRDLPTPNVLRIMVGESVEKSVEKSVETKYIEDEAVIIETEIDDMNPELFPHVQTKLLERGALSVSLQQVLLKKGRPGFRMRVLSPEERVDALLEIIFRETTTLGVTLQTVKRKKLGRKIVEIETCYGQVRVKLGMLGNEIVNVAPEYEDCKKLAEEQGVALKEVYKLAHECAFRLAFQRRRSS